MASWAQEPRGHDGEQLTAEWLREERHCRRVLAGGPAPAVELTDEMIEELRALGYLH